MKRWYSLPLALLAAAALACSVFNPGGGPTNAPPTASNTPSAADTTPSPTPAASDTPAPAATTEAAPSPTTAPATATTPPQTLLAYVQDGEVIVADVTGSVMAGTVQLTQPGVNDGVYDIHWAPSGALIAFVSATGGDPHIYVADPAGANPPVDLGLGSQPSWSPDSTRLVYVRTGNIWLTAVDNPQPAALTDKENWGWGRPIFNPAGDGLVVSGAPFEQMGAQGNTEFTFSTLPLDGSGVLTPLAGMTQPVEGRLPYDLRFSPDGQKLAFFTSWHLSACQSAGAYYVLNADGSGLLTLNSPAMEALVTPNTDITYIGFGYAWKPASDGLLISSVVIDCTNFAGTQLGAQLSSLGLDQQETLVATGMYSSPSYDRSGSLIAVAQQADNTSPSEVVVLAPNGDLVLDVGAGGQPAFQP
ncbi:MAG: hypothetical protein ABI847_15405 [Anaerolineales bacterium]